MIETANHKLYTGITTNPLRRWQQHRTGKGAKFFLTSAAQTMVYLQSVADRSIATKREIEIKKLNRAQKCKLLNDQSNEVEHWQSQFAELENKAV